MNTHYVSGVAGGENVERKDVRIRPATQIDQRAYPGTRNVIEGCLGGCRIAPISTLALGDPKIALHNRDFPDKTPCPYGGEYVILSAGKKLPA